MIFIAISVEFMVYYSYYGCFTRIFKEGIGMVEKDLKEADVRLYYEDSYRKTFEAQVLSCEELPDGAGCAAVFDSTAFCPEGGGQYADTGSIDGYIRVFDVKERDGVIYHYLDTPVKVGNSVTGMLDFQERFDKMQQHTGEHIVSGIIHNLFGYDNVGFHLGKDVVTMDFNGVLTDEQLRVVEENANKAITENIVVETRFLSGEELKSMNYRSKMDMSGTVRLVIIEGYDICACCAPHVAVTGEVGVIKLVSAVNYKGGTRVTMVCGFRALADYNVKEREVFEISHMLSAKPDEIVEAVAKLREQLVKEKTKVSRLTSIHITDKVHEIIPGTKLVILCEEELSANAMREYVNQAMEKTDGLCCAFSGSDETGYRYLIGSRSVDVTLVAQAFLRIFSAKGGGKPPMIQGAVAASIEEVRELLLGMV